jgi:hypothetical protein
MVLAPPFSTKRWKKENGISGRIFCVDRLVGLALQRPATKTNKEKKSEKQAYSSQYPGKTT